MSERTLTGLTVPPYVLPPGMVLGHHWLGIAVAQWPPLPTGAVALHYTPGTDSLGWPAAVDEHAEFLRRNIFHVSRYPPISKDEVRALFPATRYPPAAPATLSAPPEEA